MLRVYKRLLSTSIRNLRREPKRRRRDPNDDETQLLLHKSKGQHLLTNHRVLDSIVQKSAIKPTDTVLEIGPGTGNLTLKLLGAAQDVVAVEIDKRMVEILRRRVADQGFEDQLRVIHGDFLKTELPGFDLVVANVPYNISAPIVERLAYTTLPFRSATLLLQKEFAARMTAKPGSPEFGRLAANVAMVANVEHSMDVSRHEFFPRPKVDSALVILRPKCRSEISSVNLDEWRAFTKACFGTKNKTLAAIFKQKKKVSELLGMSETSGDGDSPTGGFREKVVGVLRSGGFEEKRPSKMGNEDLVCLLDLFNKAGIYFLDRSKCIEGNKNIRHGNDVRDS